MSKSNVNPNHYKVAGRERQGEDILQHRHKQKLAETLARERFEPRAPTPGAAPRRKAKAAAHAAKPVAEKRTPTPTTRRAPTKAQASAKIGNRTTVLKRASSRTDELGPAAGGTVGAQRKKPSPRRVKL
jgi:hypothetical protein